MKATILGAISPNKNPAILKLMGQLSCGFPSPGLDFENPPLSLDELVNLREPSTFVGQAFGQSMTGIGIFDGDWIIVDRAMAPEIGDAIVAMVNGEFTVKTLSINEQSLPVLRAENPSIAPLTFGPDEIIEVFGVVTCAIHPLKKGRMTR